MALVDVDLADAQTKVSRITDVLSKEFVISFGDSEVPVRVSAAVGVATWLPGDTLTGILQRADAAMYEQKQRNKRLSPQ